MGQRSGGPAAISLPPSTLVAAGHGTKRKLERDPSPTPSPSFRSKENFRSPRNVERARIFVFFFQFSSRVLIYEPAATFPILQRKIHKKILKR